MKKIVYPVIILSILLLIANCPAPFNSIDMPGSGALQLPQDEVSYTSRSFSEDFTYKTLFPVQLDITAKLYDQSADSSGEPEPLSSDTANVKLKLVNASGTVVFESFLGDDGHLKTTVYLPAVSEDITLTLQADGFKTREVVIEDMVEYRSIVRTMSMGRSDSFVSAKGMELDSDGDGIPDSYDVEAFQVNIPADGKLTVAYEDLYGRADAGDADYNDFITAYSITETISSDGTKLEKIYVEASGKEKLAGYDHIFGFRLNSFSGLADISGEYVDRLGNTRSFELLDQESPVNIELFKSTSVAKNKTAQFTVTFQEKQNIDESAGDIAVDRPPYNPYLYVKNTGHDVHLIGEESLDGIYNSFMDENHFPWALLLPIDWDPPAERQRIEEKYPRFTRWRESGGELSRDWYLHNDPYQEEIKVYTAGYYEDGVTDNDVACYWVNDERTDLSSPSYNARANAIFVFNDDVYVVGYEGPNGSETACLWKNDVKIQSFTTGTETRGEAQSVYVDESGVYASGYYRDGISETLWYWDEIEEEIFVSDNQSAEANTVIADSGEVYVSGYYDDGEYPFVATYWRNGIEVPKQGLYRNRSMVLDMDVDANSNVYLSGFYDNGSSYAPAYWINDSASVTTLEADEVSFAFGIDENEGEIYTAGFHGSGVGTACYWIGTSRTELEPGRAFDIVEHDGSLYIVGYYHDGSKKIASYWRNGTRFELYDSNSANADAEAFSIMVTN